MEKCLKLTAMLETLKQVAVVQFHRTPLVPYFHPVTNPDRDTLMENIKAVTPNHAHRVESIEMAKCVQHKKKELVMGREGVRQFENQLRVQKDHLHKMDSVSQLDNRREKRMIALYMEEKAQREEELAKEMKWEQKVAERKRREERERVKERLIQKEDEKKKKKRRRVEQLRSSMEGDQSSQSVTGDDSCGEWFHDDLEEDSSHFSSSFSSTASLLDHVRSLNEKDKQSKMDEPPVTTREDHQLIHTMHAAKQSDESTVESQESHVQLEKHSAEERAAEASTNAVQNHSNCLRELPQKTSKGNSLPVPPPKASKPLKKTKQQQDTRLPVSKTRSPKPKQKSESQPKKGHQAKGKHTQRTQLNNTQMNTRGAVQSPTTSLNTIFKASSPQETHKKHSNHTRTQKNAQPAKQTPKEPSRKFQPQRVPLNDSTASPVVRRPGSADALLEDSHSTKTHTKSANHHHQISHASSHNSSTAHPTARRVCSSDALLKDSHPVSNNHTAPTNHPASNVTSLANAPPKTRKSIARVSGFDDEVHVYDLLEKKVRPQTKRREPPRPQSGFQTPVSDVGVQQHAVACEPPQTSASQPDNFDFSSNPSYERGATAKEGARGATGGTTAPSNNTRQTSFERNNGLLVQNQTSTKMHQPPPHMHHSGPKSSTTALVRQSYVQNSMKPKQVMAKTTNMQPAYAPSWPRSDSESSESEHIRSVLSDNSHHSTMSTITAQQSKSSGFSTDVHSDSNTSSHTPKPPRVQQSVLGSLSPPPLPGDNLTNHSGLPVPRKMYNSHQQGQPSGRGQSKASPQPLSRRPNNGIGVRDKDALTSYPRFQRREEHKARLQNTEQQHRMRQFGVHPGTGQLTQFTKPARGHLVQQSKRRPDVGSLV